MTILTHTKAAAQKAAAKKAAREKVSDEEYWAIYLDVHFHMQKDGTVNIHDTHVVGKWTETADEFVGLFTKEYALKDGTRKYKEDSFSELRATMKAHMITRQIEKIPAKDRIRPQSPRPRSVKKVTK